MNLSGIKKIAGKFSFRKRSEFNTIGEKANHDWKYMLIVFTCLTIISISGSLYIFVKINKGEIFLVEKKAESKEVSIDDKRLKTVTEMFEIRNMEFQKLVPGALKDPSI